MCQCLDAESTESRWKMEADSQIQSFIAELYYCYWIFPDNPKAEHSTCKMHSCQPVLGLC